MAFLRYRRARRALPFLLASCVLAAPQARAASCGRLNQPPCGLTEGTRPCQAGLIVKSRRCERPKRDPRKTLTCGGRNRSPCGKPPACDRGLVVERGKCVPVPKEE